VGFPTPQGAVIGYLGCCLPDAELEINQPEWFEYDFIFNQYGFPNLSLSYVKPSLEWFEILMDLIPPPTDPEKFASYIQKVISLTANMTLPSMQAKTLLDLKFPTGPGFDYNFSLEWLLAIPEVPKFPEYKIEFEGASYYPPNLKDLVLAHFTVKFDLFSDLIIGPLKKPKLPEIPSYEDFINIYLNKINAKLNLPTIPMWQLMSPEYKDKIPAIGLHLQNFCQAKFFVDMLKILVP